MGVESFGLVVSHLMVMFPGGDERASSARDLGDVINKAQANGLQVLCGKSFGHEADAIVMALGKTSDEILDFEQNVKSTGAVVVDSFLSLTELSEYTTTENQEQARVDALEESAEEKEKMMSAWRERMEIYNRHKLYPELPAKKYMCFYPMSKKREVGANWYSLDFEKRAELMRAHGMLGRTYSGRILQLITGSTGLTDWEWGVTLLSDSMQDIKSIVYEMRFDEASALYGEFGHFTMAQICEPGELVS